MTVLVVFYSIGMSQPAFFQMSASEGGPVLASGTLNLVLANKKGIVIATDSRMSSDTPFPCGNLMQRYCDNSQKLFRTGDRSALAIAGFAVGKRNSPVDLGLASVLRKRFGTGRLPGEQGEVALVAEWAELALQQVLTGVAALYDPTTTRSDNLFLMATFVGFDKKAEPVIKQRKYVESWNTLWAACNIGSRLSSLSI